ncbi:MFS transporter [Paraburkholderia phytofirmans]|uniref:MFS transporter n=1 Tax=Paraburkholderia sp. BL9I2N2 TaxID=1938809 RepID=UPI00104D00DE|nr:MFS transporter [Paraburkholderia sp. BL9I2N2]TCK88766.1 AAHS family 4-hydroxybenzoate transporter-like MFS transporter [Paraburkholderia sp. BL9I2N2]
MSSANSSSEVVDVQAFIDQQRFSPYQWLILGLCFLIVAADGFDTAAGGFVAPALAREWGLTRLELGPILSAALIGSVVGALIAGPLADRIGRKRVLVGAVLSFGTFSLACTQAHSTEVLTMLRLCSGIGLGAAMPNATTMISEYVPAKHRGLLVNVMFCGFTIGASAGGFAAAVLIPAFGWRSVFFASGAVPLLLAVALLIYLPESVRFMVAKSWPAARVNAVLGRISGTTLTGQRFTLHEQSGATRQTSVALILSKNFRAGTLLLWLTYFMGLLVYFLLTSWLPTLLKDSGMTLKHASLITALFPLGGGLGSIACGYFMDRANAHRVVAFTYILTGVFLWSIGQLTGGVFFVGVLIFIAGTCLNGAQVSMPVIAAAFYPTNGRASGVAWMLGIGRIGGIVGSMAGASFLQAGFGIGSILSMLAIPSFIAAAALLLKDCLARRQVRTDVILQQLTPDSD